MHASSIDDEPTDPGSFKSGSVCDAGRVYGVDFEVVALVASGGMGEVYKVKDRRTGRHHAMKVMRPELARDTALVDRFEKEGIALTRFKHRGVVRAEQVGYDRDIGPYIIMELLEGMTLADLMARYGRRLPAAQAIPILVEVALALELIHQQGIFHRDIKPQNIFLHKTEGQPRETKVLDFGAMKAHSGSLHFSSTDSGKTIGTPRYMAPEQLVARPVGAFTDVYALGVVAYEILSFSSLFGAEVERANLDEIRMFHLFAERIPLHHVVPDAPPSLWDALERATRREPGQRTATMQRLAEDLKRALGDVVAVERARSGNTVVPDSHPSDVGLDSDASPLDVARARLAKRLHARGDLPRPAEQRAPAGPYHATAYGLHLVDLGALDVAAGIDSRVGAADARSGEQVVVDVEAMLRERSDMAAKLAAYQKARAELGTLPPLDPVAIRKLLAEIDERIAAAVARQHDVMAEAETRRRRPLPALSNDRSPRRPSPMPGRRAATQIAQVPATRVVPAVEVTLGHLIGLSGPATTCDLHIGLVPLRIGRDEPCQLRLDDEKVSALHATIARTDDDAFEIVDADSTNGTRVNGRTITRARLQVGDRIGIGGSTLEFRLAERKERHRRRRTVREPVAANEPSSPAVATHVSPSPARPLARTKAERIAVGGALVSIAVLASVLVLGRASQPPQAKLLRSNHALRDIKLSLAKRVGSARPVLSVESEPVDAPPAGSFVGGQR